MVKKFKIIQNLEKKYNGENLPIRVRQDDVGTIIESQILTEDNNPYDLSKCSVTFNLQPATGVPVLGEKVTITDAINGKISYSLSAKDTKHSGRVKSAFFTITNADNSIVESTGDIDLTVMPFPKLLESDYLTETSNFYGKKVSDMSNPNLISHPGYLYKRSAFHNYFTDCEMPQEFYDESRFPAIYLYDFDSNNSFPCIVYFLKIKENTQIIKINNLINDTPSTISIVEVKGEFGLTDHKGETFLPTIAVEKAVYASRDKFNQLNVSSLKSSAIVPLKVNSLGNITDLKIDLTKGNFLTSDGYLAISSEFLSLRDNNGNLIDSKLTKMTPYDSYERDHNGGAIPKYYFYNDENKKHSGAVRLMTFNPQLEWTQYYLPE